MSIEGRPLATVLEDRKHLLVQKWLELTLKTYPESSSRFLTWEKDPFRNPVGHTLKEGLPVLFDGLIRRTDVAALVRALDGIVRIRAVQEFSASEAVGFVFLLKGIIRQELEPCITEHAGEWATFEAGIDHLVLLAFDIYTKCRQQIFDIKTKESRRMSSVVDRDSRLGEEESIG